MLTDKARTNTFGQQVYFQLADSGLVLEINLHKLASDVGDLFGLLVNGQRAVPIHVEQVLTDQVLVVDERRAADHLTTLYDTLSDKGYTSVPRCHQNSDASQDALKLVPDSSF